MTEKNKISGIKSWPEDDRPREKLLKKGAGALSNSELLAILLRTGTTGTSAIDLARNIFKKFGTFRNMAHTDAREWKEFKGLGDAKIAHIQAALEIGRRFREDEASTGKQKIASAKDVVDIVMPQLRDLKTEMFKVVYLDSNNRIIDIVDTAVGTVDQAFPIVREIIHAALQKFAKSIVCAHNHPSANITPSTEDKRLTEEAWLLLSALYIEIQHRSAFFIEYLTKFDDEDSVKRIGRIFLKVLETATPTFRQEEIQLIVERLYKIGEKDPAVKADADNICNTYGRRGIHFFKDLFYKYQKTS